MKLRDLMMTLPVRPTVVGLQQIHEQFAALALQGHFHLLRVTIEVVQDDDAIAAP